MTTDPEADAAAPPAPADRANALALVPLGLAVLAVLAVTGWIARRAFDRTDEGFYVLSAAHPRDVTADVLEFGYAYHPLLLLARGDLVAYRWLGIATTVAVCGWLAWVVLGTPALLGGRAPWRPALRAGTAVGLGVTGLLSLVSLPSSPSYNTLALQGICLTSGGLVVAATRVGRHAPAGWFVVGVGGWLAFLGKPTSAAVLAGVVVLAWLVVPGRWRLGVWAGGAGVVTAAGVMLLAYRLGPGELVANVRTGLQASRALGGHDDLLRRDPLPDHPGVLLPALALAVAVAVLLLLVRRTSSRPGLVGAAVGTLGLVAVGVAFAVLAAPRWWTDEVGRSVTPFALVVVGGLAGAGLALTLAGQVAAALVRRGRGGLLPGPPGGRWRAARTTAGLTLVLLAVPAAYAFGTNGNLWSAAGRAAVAWLIVLTARLTAAPATLRLAPALVATVLLVPLQVAATGAPYRGTDLRTATVAAPVGSGSVLLTPHQAGQAEAARREAARLGIGPTTRVLDLTGASAGTVYLLGARPVGQAWLIGGYSGSTAAARVVLGHARCALTDALVLVDSSAPRAVPPSVLGVAGLDLARDYEPVGEVPYERGASRRAPAPPDARAVLHRLRHPVSIPGCR